MLRPPRKPSVMKSSGCDRGIAPVCRKQRRRMICAAIVGGATLLLCNSTQAASATWNVNANGNWTVNTNWNPNSTHPNGIDEIAGLTNNISTARTITLDASQTIGHRLTGSENGKKAEEFAYNLLKSYGIADVRYEPFEVESWSRGTLSVSVGSSVSALQPVKSVALAHSPVKVDLAAEVVDMGNGLEEDYASKPGLAKDKIAQREGGISGMQGGIADLITRRELRDLVEYMATLK